MNLPVRGEPVEVLQYFRQPNKSHLLALLGGMVWTAGTVSLFVALSATSASATRGTESLPLLGPATAVQVLLGAALLAGLWGLLAWKEFADAPGRTRALVAMALGLLFAGLILILLAPPLSV
jgi:glucose uptake protein